MNGAAIFPLAVLRRRRTEGVLGVEVETINERVRLSAPVF
jgi:hypothetical protein